MLSLIKRAHCNHEQIKYLLCFEISLVLRSTVISLGHPVYTRIKQTAHIISRVFEKEMSQQAYLPAIHVLVLYLALIRVGSLGIRLAMGEGGKITPCPKLVRSMSET